MDGHSITIGHRFREGAGVGEQGVSTRSHGRLKRGQRRHDSMKPAADTLQTHTHTHTHTHTPLPGLNSNAAPDTLRKQPPLAWLNWLRSLAMISRFRPGLMAPPRAANRCAICSGLKSAMYCSASAWTSLGEVRAAGSKGVEAGSRAIG